MSESDKVARITRHLMIHGRVQGVYYRASAQREALRLNLAGWVRNRRSGAVEALVSGPEPAVVAFIEWAGNGPPAARVDHIEVGNGEAPKSDRFSMLPTE